MSEILQEIKRKQAIALKGGYEHTLEVWLYYDEVEYMVNRLTELEGEEE